MLITLRIYLVLSINSCEQTTSLYFMYIDWSITLRAENRSETRNYLPKLEIVLPLGIMSKAIQVLFNAFQVAKMRPHLLN